jgi:hypothetical protein
MAYVIYQDHTIQSAAVYDQVSGRWKAAAYITWDGGSGSGTRHFHLSRNSPELFSRLEDAETAGIEAAKNWVDSKQPQRSATPSMALPAVLTSKTRDGNLFRQCSSSEYQPSIKFQEAILHVASLGYQLRKSIKASQKNIYQSRQLVKETKITFEQSRLIILVSQRLRQGLTSQ